MPYNVNITHWVISGIMNIVNNFRFYFAYTPNHVRDAANPSLGLRHLLQGMPSKRSRAGWNNAGYLDCCQMPAVRREAALPAIRDIQRQTFDSAWTQACTVCGVSLMGEMKRGEAWEEQRQVMEGYKLKNRMETPAWNPPLLSFNIERHGATVNDSIYAEVQHWIVNMQTEQANLEGCVRRQVKARDKRLNVESYAEAISASIISLR